MCLCLGSTFVKKTTAQIPPHLYIIISDPQLMPDQVVVVNLTGYRENILKDGSCVLERGEHSFITKKSYVYYRQAKCAKLNNLQNLLKLGGIEKLEDVSSEMLTRIQQGAANSQFTPNEVLNILEEQGFIDLPPF